MWSDWHLPVGTVGFIFSLPSTLINRTSLGIWMPPAGHSFAMLAFLEELWPSAGLVVAAQGVPEELWGFLRVAPIPD